MGPIYFIQSKAIWFLNSESRLSFSQEIFQKKKQILFQISYLVNLPWKAALRGHKESLSLILKRETTEIIPFFYKKPSVSERIWPIALTSLISCVYLVKVVADVDFNWWLSLLFEWKETVFQFFKLWIVTPMKEIWSTIRYKTGRFGIGSSLASDAEVNTKTL